MSISNPSSKSKSSLKSLKLKTSRDVESMVESPPPFESIKTPEESPIQLYNATPAPSPSPEVDKTPTPVNLSISSFSDVSGPPSTKTSVSTTASANAAPAFSSIDTSSSNASSVPSIPNIASSKSTRASKTPTPAATPVSSATTSAPTPKVKSSASIAASVAASNPSSIKIASSPLVPMSTPSASSLSATSIKSFATAVSKTPRPRSKQSSTATPATTATDATDATDANETVYTLSATPQNTSASSSDIEPAAAAAAPSVELSSVPPPPPSSLPPSLPPPESASEIPPPPPASASEITPPPPPPPESPPIKEFVFGEKKKIDKTRNKSLKAKDDKELESIKDFNMKKQESGKQPAPAADAGASPPPSPEQHVDSSHEAYDFLYPTLDDPNFNIKIASKKEFGDTQYDGTVYNSLEKIKEHANKMCNAEFELSPHQLFVRNFLSFQTPYNSLLLYHGLGTGKTCSAITICEEMRDYLSQIGLSTSRKIIVVASPNVQQNFRLQLFDRRK